MGKMNAAWHHEHPMPKNPRPAQKIAWHLDYARHCGCRGIPASMLALMAAPGIIVPEGHDTPPK